MPENSSSRRRLDKTATPASPSRSCRVKSLLFRGILRHTLGVNWVQFSRPQHYPASIVRAFAVSLALHLAVVGGGELSQRFRSWKHSPWNQSSKLAEERGVVIPPGAKKNPLTTDPRDVTIVLVDIDPIPHPTEASNPTKPVQSKNPEPKREDLIATQPTLPTGAETVQAPLVTLPSPPPQKNPPPSETANAFSKGDLSVADPLSEKLQTKPSIATNTAQASKPAATENQRPQSASSAAASGVKPAGISEKPTSPTAPPPRPTLAIDLKASPFGNYDSAIVAAVQKRWYELLDERKSAREGKGRVVVEFRLKYDGHISDLKITYREVDDILSLICQRAVTDPAPFAAWPRDMRRTVAGNSRSVRFTFFY